MFDIPGLKKKIYIAVVGMPDCGKSTFIKYLTEYITRRKVNVDSFCNEQMMDMTIRSAQIFLRDRDLPYDIVFLDCPGHIFEYKDEVESVISKAHFVLRIINDRQDDVVPYNDDYRSIDHWNAEFEGLNTKEQMVIHSHSDIDSWDHYDADGIKTDKFDDLMKHIADFISQHCYIPVDPIETAIRIVDLACDNIEGKKTAMCSFGKDSLAMLQIFRLAGRINEIKIEYPVSGFDLPGISEKFRRDVSDHFGCEIEGFPVIHNGWNFDNHICQQMMLCKARMLNDRINANDYTACFTGIRRDEEGTRAKEKFFSPRKTDGSFDYLVPQKEIFGYEFPVDIVKKYPQMRVNPLLDLCEADIWYMTRYFSIPVCDEYISKNGKRYRSLGDWPVTTPIDSKAKTIDEICEEVDVSLIPERACRQKQDKCVKFGMEKLRKAGFF